MSDDGLASNRQRVRNELGTEFERKASDAFCVTYPRPTMRGGGSRTVLELRDVPDGFAVPEGFVPPPEPEAPAAAPVRMRGGPRGAPENPDEDPIPRPAPRPEVEQALLRSLASMEELRAALAQRAQGGPVMRGSGGGGGAAIPYDLCWLNHTVRVGVAPRNARRIAELAGDPRVARIDVTRTLERELRRSVPTLIGVAGLKERASLPRPVLTGREVIVAVIDSEIARNHPALRGRVFRRRRFTEERWNRPSLHGTAVAGVIAACGEEVGVAPDAVLYNYKVLGCTDVDDADDFDVGLALQAALRDGAHIANLSLGSTALTDGRSREVRACNRAWNLGLTIVKSAGNKGNAPETITCPGDAEGVIVVGATDAEGRGVQEYSSRGPTRNGKTRPDLVAPGGIDGIAELDSTRVDGTFGCCGWGTTLAAAHVSGLLALMLEENPNRTPGQLRDDLLALCEPFRCDENVQGRGFPRRFKQN